MMMPARGPVSVLCVVLVTTSQYGTGLGCAPAAMRPAMCAMSAMSMRAALVGDRAEGGEVDGARVRAVAADDELGAVLQRQLAHLVVVDELRVRAHVVRDHVVGAPRVVDAHAVCEVPAVGQRHGQHRVAGLEQREQHREVGRRAGVRLHVGVLGAEHLLAAVDGELLDLVDHVAAAVVARARQSLRVLVGQHGAGGLEHGAAGEVLAGDELQRLLLADELAAQQLVELGVQVIERLAPPLAADGAQADSSTSRSSTRCS